MKKEFHGPILFFIFYLVFWAFQSLKILTDPAEEGNPYYEKF